MVNNAAVSLVSNTPMEAFGLFSDLICFLSLAQSKIILHRRKHELVQYVHSDYNGDQPGFKFSCCLGILHHMLVITTFTQMSMHAWLHTSPREQLMQHFFHFFTRPGQNYPSLATIHQDELWTQASAAFCTVVTHLLHIKEMIYTFDTNDIFPCKSTWMLFLLFLWNSAGNNQ